MEWLNYHHLYYFWRVARLDSVTAAAAELRVAQPTVSGQLRALERSLGERLFVRHGRGLALTETGRTVLRYADEIFSIGRELQDTLHGRVAGRPQRFAVGITDALPRLLAYQLLSPAVALQDRLQLVVRQDRGDRLLADLATHAVDLVLADTPVPPGSGVRAFAHALGECGVLVCGSQALADAYRPGFPGSLDGAPLLLPGANSALRRELDGWFDHRRLRPRVVMECDDSALLKSFGRAGVGLVVIPTVAEDEAVRQYGLSRIGGVDGVRERFYAISLERRVKHPAVRAISTAARSAVFGAAIDRESR
ncbi:MAG: LysR family transcriptional regulator [Polyangiales bacterium]